MSFKPTDVRDLREKTGAGMMDCKKALTETNGNMDAAVEFLRKKGLAAAQKKSGRIATEGLIGTYVHSGRIGVMVEINCETDFVAKNNDFQEFVKDVAMHVAAADPKFVSSDEMDDTFRVKEAAIYEAQLRDQGKPEKMIPNIVKGKLDKLASEVCLLDQAWVKDPSLKISDLQNQLVLKIGEKIAIRRFVRWSLGEGLEKKKADNLAEEVAKLSGK